VIDERHYGEPGVDIKGTGTRSEDLKAAGIAHAVGLVAGNASDPRTCRSPSLHAPSITTSTWW
jgi:hypothetical protein